MINMNVVKKYTGLVLVGFSPVVLYNIFLMSGWGLLWAVGGAIAGLIFGLLLYNFIYKHPLMQMIEGKGILVLTIDSTGIIQPYIAKVNPPYISVKGKKGSVFSVFDRKTISYLKTPKKAEMEIKQEGNNKVITMKMKNNEEHKYLFSFDGFPVFIYNKNLETFLSKEALSKLEMNSSVKHMVFYLKKKTEELTSIMRDFARYVIEMSKPRQQFAFLSSWWFWIIVIAAIVLIVMFFMPNIMGGANPIVNAMKDTTIVQ